MIAPAYPRIGAGLLKLATSGQRYYGNYERREDWRSALGAVEGRPAALAFAPDGLSAPPIYFVLLRRRSNFAKTVVKAYCLGA